MWKILIRNRLREKARYNSDIAISDIVSASSILFSVFSRYGDSIIAYKVINEFIARHPGKRYIVITSNQTLPYANAIINGNVEIQSVNIRKNPVKFLKIVAMLKKTKIDLAFNPWSHGEDSEFFMTFAKKYLFYKKYTGHPKEYNLYARVREYLLLGSGGSKIRNRSLEGVNNILISPFSTDITKSLNSEDLNALIQQVSTRFPDASIIVASQKNEMVRVNGRIERFIFRKKLDESVKFLALLKLADLFIGVDAGPLHLADAVGVTSIGIFGPTAPETILDSDSGIMPVRHEGLNGCFCFVRDCRNPVCIHKLFENNFLDRVAVVDPCGKVALETETCRLSTSSH
ncbi:MAG: glycosyltransferase family 9 protein [Dissulfurispiraceae bacterium]|jgi:ADP-heptose:LPS heptosyltransferase